MKHTEPKCIVYLGNVFCITVIISIFSYGALLLEKASCDFISLSYWIARGIATYFSIAHTWLLLLLYYRRMELIFMGSVCQLTRCVVIFYNSLFTIYFFVGCMMPIIRFIVPLEYRLFLSTVPYITCYMSTLISLSILFIYKLYQVGQNIDVREMLEPITKLTILSLSSISISLMSAIALAIGKTNYVTEFIMAICLFIDIFSNQLFIILYYKHYQEFYLKICGKMDNGCVNCIQNRMTQNEDQERTLATTLAGSINKSSDLTIPTNNVRNDKDEIQSCQVNQMERTRGKSELPLIDTNINAAKEEAEDEMDPEIEIVLRTPLLSVDTNDQQLMDRVWEENSAELTQNGINHDDETIASNNSFTMNDGNIRVENNNKLNLSAMGICTINADVDDEMHDAFKTPSIPQSTSL